MRNILVGLSSYAVCILVAVPLYAISAEDMCNAMAEAAVAGRKDRDAGMSLEQSLREGDLVAEMAAPSWMSAEEKLLGKTIMRKGIELGYISDRLPTYDVYSSAREVCIDYFSNASDALGN